MERTREKVAADFQRLGDCHRKGESAVGELSLDDLPPTYARDEGLAQALGMLQPVVGLAARRLGVPAEVLWGLSAHPDLVTLVERELADRADRDQGER